MEDWQERLLDEKAELEKRKIKLFQYLRNNFDGSLTTQEELNKKLLEAQLHWMSGYLDVLQKRVELL